MLAKIIPARRMPPSLPFLDYELPEKFSKDAQAGQLVTAPFRNKQIFGIIHSLVRKSETDPKKIKPLSGIVFPSPLLSGDQMEFIKEISEFYQTPPGFIIKGNLPPLQKRKLAKAEISDFSGREKSKFAKPFLFVYRSILEKEKIIKTKIKNGQVLILVPEVGNVPEIAKLIPKNLADETVAVTGGSSPKQEFENWFAIRNGVKRVVIGTRKALFLPWFDLQTIIMDDEANPNYKSWDMAPRIHTRDAATFLAKHHGAELIFLTHSPSVETFYFAREKIYQFDKAEVSSFNAKTEIVDMKEERRGGNFGFLSERMMEAMENSKGDCFLFLNRRGSASFVGCRDCGNVIKCPECHLALNFHQDSGQLICHYCGYKEPMVTRCKVCQGVNVAMFGVGTQQAEKEAHKILGANSSRKVIRIDSDVNRLEEANPLFLRRGQGEVKTMKLDSPKIIIGTQLAWPYINWEKTDVVAFLDADTSLFIPEYKVTETLWQLIRQTQFKMRESAEGKIIIQTGHPDHLIYQSLSKPTEFYEHQLTERRALGYPPFKYLVKFFAGHPNLQSIKKEASDLSFRLSGLTKANSDITILGPLEASPQFLDGLYWEIILAKINYQTYKRSVKLLMSGLPENWKADPNPNTILQFS